MHDEMKTSASSDLVWRSYLKFCGEYPQHSPPSPPVAMDLDSSKHIKEKNKKKYTETGGIGPGQGAECWGLAGTDHE